MSRLISRLRTWFWPLGAAAFLVPAVAITVLVLAGTWEMLTLPYPRWVEVSAQFHQQTAFAGIVAGTAGAYHASRLNPVDRLFALPGAVRLGPRVVMRHLWPLLGWCLGAYVLGMLPLLTATMAHGGVGSAQPLVMLSGLVAMAAMIVFGYTLATVLPSMVMVLLTALLLYALVPLGTTGAVAFVPVLEREPTLGLVESPSFVWLRIGLYMLIVAAGVGIASSVLCRRARAQHRSVGRVVDVGLFACAPIMLAAVAMIVQPTMFAADGAPPRCQQHRGLQVCVHPANAPRLPQLIAAVDPILDRYGIRPTTVDAVWDRALAADQPHGAPIGSAASVIITPSGIDIGASVLTDMLSGTRACMHEDLSSPAAADGDRVRFRITRALEHYLSGGRSPDVGVFDGMSQQQIKDWIAQHQRQLADCDLDTQDLPRS